ncbi:MAG: hypothetical protein V2B19_02775 [Pseudomonadota bacterium]
MDSLEKTRIHSPKKWDFTPFFSLWQPISMNFPQEQEGKKSSGTGTGLVAQTTFRRRAGIT